jgi:hypothetical protein
MAPTLKQSTVNTSSNPMSRKLNTTNYTWLPLMANIIFLLILLSLYVYLYQDTPTVEQIGLMATSTHTAIRSVKSTT